MIDRLAIVLMSLIITGTLVIVMMGVLGEIKNNNNTKINQHETVEVRYTMRGRWHTNTLCITDTAWVGSNGRERPVRAPFKSTKGYILPLLT